MKKLIIIFLALTSYNLNAQEQTTSRDSIKETREISELIIKSQRKKNYADKSVYSFDKEALEKARYANDLLISIPELQYDPISNSVTSIKGGTTLFLINGIEATEIQIRTIRPENVIKVEYYDNPPTKYANRANIVVNLITRNPETGYVYGSEINTALTTGFVNGTAYANYTHKRNNFGLEYFINVRDYNNRQYNRKYIYNLDGDQYNTNELSKDHFGYTNQSIALRYTNSLPENYVFQTKLNINSFDYFSKGVGTSQFIKNDLTELHGNSSDNGNDNIIPKLDLYFSKNINKNQEISINLIGSAYSTHSFNNTKEWSLNNGENVFNNEMNLNTQQRSFVGEIAYTNNLKLGQLNLGYRISNNKVSNDLTNLTGFSTYEVNYLQQYLYSEFSGKKRKIMYRLGLGVNNIHNTSENDTENSWIVSPKLILGYELKKNMSLRLSSSYSPSSPSSSALSSNVVQIAPNIVSKGNPYLKSEKNWNNNITYSLNNKYFDFNANLFYRFVDRAINQYFVLDNNFTGYALTYENAKNSENYGLQLSGTIKPFGNNILAIKTVITPASENLTTSLGAKIKNNYLGNYFVISSEFKNWTFQYQFNIPVYTLQGAFLSTNENQNNIFARYKLNNWTFVSGIYWIGMPSEYKTKSLPESLVNYTNNTKIHNNNSMLMLGVAYNFAKGKKTEVNRKLNNDTAPAATF